MAGIVVSEVHPVHALMKLVPDESKSVARKDVMAVQPDHAPWNLIPPVSGIAGKVTREVHPLHVM